MSAASRPRYMSLYLRSDDLLAAYSPRLTVFKLLDLMNLERLLHFRRYSTLPVVRTLEEQLVKLVVYILCLPCVYVQNHRLVSMTPSDSRSTL